MYTFQVCLGPKHLAEGSSQVGNGIFSDSLSRRRTNAYTDWNCIHVCKKLDSQLLLRWSITLFIIKRRTYTVLAHITMNLTKLWLQNFTQQIVYVLNLRKTKVINPSCYKQIRFDKKRGLERLRFFQCVSCYSHLLFNETFVDDKKLYYSPRKTTFKIFPAVKG